MNYQKLIIKLRNKLIFSQTELVDLLGISFSTVNRWKKGHHEPTIKVKRKIVEFCKQNKIDLEGGMSGYV